MSEVQKAEKTVTPNTPNGKVHVQRSLSVEKKTISILKSEIESIELVNSTIEKCNVSIIGRKVTLTDIVLYSIRKLKESDFELIKDSTLTIEERTEKALLEFNLKNGTSLTLIELAMKQLKKEKRDNFQ